MKKLIFFLLIFSIGNTPLSFSQYVDNELIVVNEKIEKCRDEHNSTPGWLHCYQLELEIWKKKMQKYYQLLLKRLPSKSKRILINDQQSWLAWKKKHFKFIDALMSEPYFANLTYITIYSKKAEIYKNRALELKLFYVDLVID